MSATRERLTQVRNPTLPAQTTPEQRYWRGFTNSQLVKEHNAVTHINFDPNSPHDFAVTSSTRIQIFSSKTRKVSKTISRFKDSVYSGEFRHDGKLIVGGDASGLVQIFDALHPRTLLVSFNASTYPVHVTKFHPSNTTQLLTASDDRKVRLYDISNTAKPLLTLNDHEDYIRTASFIPGSNLIVTGCYDYNIRLFDTRVSGSQAILKLNQADPVEDLLSLNPTQLVSCGGNTIKTWDLTAAKQVRSLSNFSKTVTCLYNANERGILAGSVDGHVKVFDSFSTNWEFKFGWKFGSGVLSCAVSPNHKHLVVGLNSGLLAIRTRKTEPKVKQGVKQQKNHAFEKMMRGADYHGEYEHRIIEDDRSTASQKKLKQFEKDINSFRWADALDNALISGMSKELTITALEGLKTRGKVRVALLGRDENTLEPLLTWCLRNIDDVRTINTVSDYLAVTLEMYSEIIESSSILQELIYGIKRRLDIEIKKAEEAQKITGMLELLSV